MGAKVVCGLDVHRSLVVGVLRRDGREVETASFKTTHRDLQRLDAWLTTHDCGRVGMEATGVYWKPIYHALEDHRKVIVANPQHIKVMKGRKTDRADAAWIARKLEDEDGIPPSFIPCREVRDTRELVNLRESRIQARTQIRNEIQKTLAGAGIPIKEAISDLFGVSGQNILKKLAEGETVWDNLGGLLKGRLKKKVGHLQLCLEQSLTEVQRWVLISQLERHAQIEQSIKDVEVKLNGLLLHL